MRSSSPRMHPSRIPGASLVATLIALSPASATAQATVPFDPNDHPFAALAMSAPPRSTTVAITLTIPRGSSTDADGLEGGMWLLGQITRDQLERQLLPSGSEVAVVVARDHTTFQVVAVPAAWQTAYRALVEEVFSNSIDVRVLEHRRTEVEEVFAFEKDAPVREFKTALLEMIADDDSPWSRDPRGSSDSLDDITPTALSELRARAYRQEESVVVLVGDVDAPAGVRVYQRGREAPRPLRPSGSGTAWNSGDREPITRPVTNTWIGAGFPARKDASRTILEFLDQQLLNELNPMPRESGLLGTEVSLEYTPEGPVLLVESTISPPEEGRRWEDRVARALANIAERYEDPALFRLHQDRFRNSVLTAESAPEVQGERIAMDLLRDGRVREMSTEIGSLTADRVRQTVRQLGQPRILVFGPDLP